MGDSAILGYRDKNGVGKTHACRSCLDSIDCPNNTLRSSGERSIGLFDGIGAGVVDRCHIGVWSAQLSNKRMSMQQKGCIRVVEDVE